MNFKYRKSQIGFSIFICKLTIVRLMKNYDNLRTKKMLSDSTHKTRGSPPESILKGLKVC